MIKEIKIKPIRNRVYDTKKHALFRYENIYNYSGNDIIYTHVDYYDIRGRFMDIPSYCKDTNTLYTDNADAVIVPDVASIDIASYIGLVGKDKYFWFMDSKTGEFNGCMGNKFVLSYSTKEKEFSDYGLQPFHIIYNLYNEELK